MMRRLADMIDQTLGAGHPTGDPASFLSSCALSVFVGMRLPGRQATLLGIHWDVPEAPATGERGRIEGVLEFKSESTRTIVVHVTHTAENGRILGRGKADVRVNAEGRTMPTIEQIDDPRRCYALVQERIQRLRKAGTLVPDDLARIERSLMVECLAESQGR